MRRARVAVSMGDPQGIGPEIIVKALKDDALRASAEFIVCGSEAAFRRAKGWGLVNSPRRGIKFVAAGGEAKTAKEAGTVSLACLDAAIALIRRGEADALVTGPLSKERVALVKPGFTGHTEYLCRAFGVKHHAMMLFHSRLKVVLVTVHVPLRRVPNLLTSKLIVEKLTLAVHGLRRYFGVKVPRIAVCGLNPHAGEGGIIGDEEKRVIVPALNFFMTRVMTRGIQVSGPHPADSVFHDALAGKYDAVLCLYHDQGLIVLKSTGFDEGVNLTLGLPFLRTSPDHGTAFDIAGLGMARAGSMAAALAFAARASAYS